VGCIAADHGCVTWASPDRVTYLQLAVLACDARQMLTRDVAECGKAFDRGELFEVRRDVRGPRDGRCGRQGSHDYGILVVHVPRCRSGLTRRGYPMRLADLMRPDGGTRWCEQHRRYECTRQRHHGRGDCHGSAIRGLDACRTWLRRCRIGIPAK
jgi:hypothetical protein